MPNKDSSEQTPVQDSIQSKLINTTFSTVVISAAVVIVLSPLRSLILRMSRPDGTDPHSSSNWGSLVLFLYKGWQNLWYSALVKTGAFHNAKVAIERKEFREMEEPKGGINSSVAQFTTGLGVIGLATVATQIPDGISDLKKTIPLSPKAIKYTPHNVKALLLSNVTPRLMVAAIGFTNLYLFEPKLATKLNGNHFAAGAIAGGMTTVFGYPWSLLSDRIVHSAKINNEGKLTYQTFSFTLGEMRPVALSFPSKATLLRHARGMGTRALAGSLIFSTVAGVGKKLGPTPVEDLLSICRSRFFQPEDSRRNNSSTDCELSSSDINSPF